MYRPAAGCAERPDVPFAPPKRELPDCPKRPLRTDFRRFMAPADPRGADLGVAATRSGIAYDPRLLRETPVANHKSAVKRARQALKRRSRNRAVRSEVRSSVKELHKAIESGDAADAQAKLRIAERQLRKAATKGVLKKTTASRSVSRLAKAVGRVSA